MILSAPDKERQKDIHTLIGGLVNLQQMGIEFFRQEQAGIQPFPVFFQIAEPHAHPVQMQNIIKNRDWNALFSMDENDDFSWTLE